MINKETAKVQYTTVADQSTWYAVDFEYFITPATGLPQLKVLLGGQELTAGTDYVTGPQGIQLVVAPTAGVSLVIERDVPFTQEIDFQMGLIDPEKIERGLDESVMRDQELATGISDLDAKHDSLAEEVEEVRTVAEGAAADAASAKQVATDAASAAESASEKADEAKTAADNADSKAQEALDLANSYDTRITTAQDTADSAKTTADSALAGLDGKQDKGDYATKTELSQGLAGKADTSVTDALRNDVDGLDGQVSGIEEKIPSDASSSNQLATKADLSNIDALPSQVGNEGKFLTTDGANASWAEISQGGGIDYKWKKFEADNTSRQDVIALDIDLGALSDGKYTFFVRSPYSDGGGETAYRVVMEIQEGALVKGYFSPEPTLSAEPCSYPEWVVTKGSYFSYAYKNPTSGHFGYAGYAAYLSTVPAVGCRLTSVPSASFYVSGVFVNDSIEASDIAPVITVRENPYATPGGSFSLDVASSYTYRQPDMYKSVGNGAFMMDLSAKYIICRAAGFITNDNYQRTNTNTNAFPKTLSISGFILNNTTDSFDLVIRATRTDGFVVLRKKTTGAFPGIKSIKQGFNPSNPYDPRIAIELDGAIEETPRVYLSACWDGTNYQDVGFSTAPYLDVYPDYQWTDAKDESTSGGSGAVSSVNGKTGDVVLNAEDVGAVEKNQGSENAGKFLKVGADGQVIASAESGGGGQAAVAHDETLEGDGTDANPLKLSTSIAGEISAAQSTADKADNAAEVAQQTANLAGQEAAKALSGLAGKVNIAQGADNAGKVMTVGADGNLAPADMPETSLPDQTGNAGKFLTTDGTTASWGEAQAATVTTDATLTGTGTPDSPLGIGQSVKDSIDGKLPLAGGTMSGDINIGNNSLKMAGDVDILGNGNIGGIWVQHGGPGGGVIILNAQDHKIGNVAKLNNGADIAIPTTGGTMALLSDIPDTNAFVQKSGDTMTGTLSVHTSVSGDIIKIGSTVADGANSEITFSSLNGGAIKLNCGGASAMQFSPGMVSFNGNIGKMGTSYYYTLPNATGTLALTSDIPDVSEFQTASQVTAIADTQASAAINSRFLVVDELPAEPDANTFYFIKKA